MSVDWSDQFFHRGSRLMAWCALAHTGNQTEDTPVRVQINAALKIK